MGNRVKFTVPGEASIETALFVEGEEVDTATPELGQSLVFDGAKFTPDYPSAYLPTREPMGFENRADCQISFDNATRTFTISPTGASFTVWYKGRPYVKTAPESITIFNSLGLNYIQYSTDATLTLSYTYFDFENVAPVAYVAWDTTTSTAIYFADERHGIVLDWQTHEYLHRTRGSAFASGFGLANYTTTGSGSSNADAQLDVANGIFFDEDIEVSITHSSTPTANTWQQDLQGPARIPIYYKWGIYWKKDAATDYPLQNAYTGSSLAQYNWLITTGPFAGLWTVSAMANNKYGVTWIVATNNLNEPVIGILGQAEYGNAGDAEAATWGELNLAGFPSYEFRPLWKITYQTATAYTNTPKSRIVAVEDLRGMSTVLGTNVTGGGGGGNTTPASAVFSVAGNVAVGTGLARYYASDTLTITNVIASVGTAPTGSSIIVDVNKNGTTIFTTQANRPTITASSFVDLTSLPDVTSVAAGDYLTIDVDQRGSTIAGTDLVVQIVFA